MGILPSLVIVVSGRASTQRYVTFWSTVSLVPTGYGDFLLTAANSSLNFLLGSIITSVLNYTLIIIERSIRC